MVYMVVITSKSKYMPRELGVSVGRCLIVRGLCETISFCATDRKLFKSLEIFLELCDRLCRGRRQTGNKAAPVVVLRDMINEAKLPISDIQELFYTLRDATFAYKPPPAKLTSGGVRALFPSAKLGQWGKQKSRLKKMVKTHTDLMLALMDCQRRCWQSRDILKRYASIIEAAEISLPYYFDNKKQYKARKYAIKCFKKDLKVKQRAHSANVNKYMTTLHEEATVRNTVCLISSSLEEAIIECMNRHISEAWGKLSDVTTPKLFRGDLDTHAISTGIYNTTSKLYIITLPPEDVSNVHFNSKILRPKLEESIFVQIDPDRFPGYGSSYHLKARVSREEGIVPEYFLNPKIGDVINIKMLSSDTSIGFGYMKPTRFSWKKWGFFFIDQLHIDMESDNADQ